MAHCRNHVWRRKGFYLYQETRRWPCRNPSQNKSHFKGNREMKATILKAFLHERPFFCPPRPDLTPPALLPLPE